MKLRLKSLFRLHINPIIFVGLLAVCLSLVSFYYRYSNQETLLYVDAKEHLIISRRLFSSLTPGITQLGGVWLPLPHILNAFTIWSDTMYYSGFSGSLVSGVSYVVTALIIYKLVLLVTESKFGAIISGGIVLSNPNFLYLQSTPMTEPLSIVLKVSAVYLITKWSYTKDSSYLILGGFITALATLSRYDNWLLVPVFILSIYWYKYKISGISTKAEGNSILFATPAMMGMALWILYSFLIFNNPFNFAFTGQGSASWYATTLSSPSHGNLLTTLLTFYYVVIENIGLLPCIIGGIGLFLFLYERRKDFRTVFPLFLLIPVLFNILTLYTGQSVVLASQIPPFDLYNSRYGIHALPIVAFIAGYVVSRKNKFLKAVVLSALVIGISDLYVYKPIVLREVEKPNRNVLEAGQWFRENPTAGYVLMSDLSGASYLNFDAKIPQDKLIYEGSGEYWVESLKDPSLHASRIITSRTLANEDFLYEKFRTNDAFHQKFRPVFKNEEVTVYDLVE